MQCSVTGRFPLSTGFGELTHVVGGISTLFLSIISCLMDICHFVTHSPVGGLPGCFCLLALVSNAGVNTHTHVFVWARPPFSWVCM